MWVTRRFAAIVLTTIFLVPFAIAGDTPEPTWTESQREHWSFQPPKRPEVPKVKDAHWVRNPIDAFILKDIEDSGIKPAVEADRRALIRRVTFDLIGLPPTVEEVEAFVHDQRPDAYERVVDRLLASPHYGERQARFWLDLARFAESDGFKSDQSRPDAWRYRDWVIDAFNADMPYDRFVRLQLAGDEIAPDSNAAFIATGFNRAWPFEDNNMIPGLNNQLMLDDMTDTTTAVFLGLTVACARCHDHKFDPISQKDYYRFQAIFGACKPRDDYSLADPFESALHAAIAAEHEAMVDTARRAVEAVEQPYREKLLADKLAKLPEDVRIALKTAPEERSAFQEDLLRKNARAMTIPPKTMRAAMSEDDRKLWDDRQKMMDRLSHEKPSPLPTATGMTERRNAPPVHLLRKGNFKAPLDVVPPGFLSVLTGWTSRKGDFAIEGVSSAQKSRSTTGRRAALADWLTRADHPLTARVMVNRLWLARFGRGIVATPSDFGSQGAEPSHPELLDWLATEFVARDWSMKQLTRLMVLSSVYRQSSISSPETLSVDPDNALWSRMPRRRLEAEAVRDALLAVSGKLNLRVHGPSVFPDLPPGVQTRGGWTRSESEADRNRRSIYVFVRRNLKYPLFDAFDSPDTNLTCPERNVSVNAPQALMLLNSDLAFDLARSFAARVRKECDSAKDDSLLIDLAYRFAFSRLPSEDERAVGVRFLASAKDKDESFVDFCHVLINLNEFVFVD